MGSHLGIAIIVSVIIIVIIFIVVIVVVVVVVVVIVVVVVVMLLEAGFAFCSYLDIVIIMKCLPKKILPCVLFIPDF